LLNFVEPELRPVCGSNLLETWNSGDWVNKAATFTKADGRVIKTNLTQAAMRLF
jgi:hypothetical protein